MGQSLANLPVHAVFSTYQRVPCLTPEVRERLYPYQGAILRELKSPSLIIGGHDDHVHLLFALSKTAALSDVLKTVKGSSTNWLKSERLVRPDFAWQSGYAAFAVGRTEVDTVRHYIANQEQHHKVLTFREELLQLFAEYNVAFDQRYVWE